MLTMRRPSIRKIKYLVLFLTCFLILAIASIFLLRKQFETFLDLYVHHSNLVYKPSTKPRTYAGGKNIGILYGVSVDMSQILPTSKNYVRNSKGEDLIDIAHHLGVNLFRISSVDKSFNSSSDSIYTKKQWDSVLNKMNANGIQALILVESPSLPPGDLSEKYLKLVKDYIIDSDVGIDSNVYAIDLRNEPLINDKNVAALSKAAKMIKSKYPGMKVTVGGWKTENPKNKQGGAEPYLWQESSGAEKLANFVDFYSLHLYGYDKPLFEKYPDSYNLTQYLIDKVRPSTHSKPILIAEFGASNGDKITDQGTIGSPELQADTYAGVYGSIEDNAKAKNITGSIAYTFYPRDKNTNGWNIIDNKGSIIYPAGYVLQNFATGKSDVPVTIPSKNIPKDFLLTNQDNGRKITIGIDDVIGLRLDLNSQRQHSVRTSSPSILLQTQPLIQENDIEKFDAVFHGARVGKTTISVTERSSEGSVVKFKLDVEVKD